mmetsp:Transcript_11619/g.17184  ORF Transcript_11619/g.17184 Transcript_11619/m.17184 type:complete len:713 (+) Transcript_11619:59-2197(+)
MRKKSPIRELPLLKRKEEEEEARKRVEAFRRKSSLSVYEEEEENYTTVSDAQIEKSVSNLAQIKQDGLNLVTKIRVDGDHEENERRIHQEALMDNLQQKLHQESTTSSKKNAAVSMKWPDILSKSIPQDIKRDLEEQQIECKKIIEGKNNILQELQNILKQKDQEYVSALRKQAKDMDMLTERMGQQIKLLQHGYEKELSEIEMSFKEERGALLEKHDEELEKLKKTRQEKEKKYVEDRIDQVEENEQELAKIRDNELEKYAETKKEKDEKVHELERSIDYMRAKYELYGEKLKYYHNLLHERVMENKVAIRNNKSKLAKLQDQLSGIKAKYAKDDRRFQQENHETTEQFKRMAKHYKDLLEKFKYFEKADTQKYNDVWKMNDKTVTDLALKLLQADKIITEQILGVQWTEPAEDFFKSPLHPTRSYRDGEFVTSQHQNTQNNTNTLMKRDTLDQTTEVEEEEDEAASTMTGVTSTSAQHSYGGNTHRANQEEGKEIAPLVRRRILEHLCDSSGFFVEKKVRDVLDGLDKNESNLLQVDAILRALGISNPEEVEKLVQLFAEGEDMDQLSDPLLDPAKREAILQEQLSIDTVMAKLTRFVELQQTSATQSAARRRKKKKILNAQERARNRQRKEERAFWTRMEDIIPPRKMGLWKALEGAQQKYAGALKDREKLIEETEMIRMQNNELRDLLNQYMSQKINEELFVPPKFDS